VSGDALFRLDGRVVIVTGASAGLGVAMATGLADAGAHVVMAARRTEPMEKLAVELRAKGVEALPLACDVSSRESVHALVDQTLSTFGRIDGLVNNAGITEVIAATDEPLETFNRVVAVNLTGAFLCAQRCAQVMLESGQGAIVNVASILGLVGVGQIPQASYAASKGGLINMTRELAAQWARRGVRVNALAPAWFGTEMTGDMFEDDRSMSWVASRTPMGRPGELDELIGPCVFLASDAASYVTGQTLAVDGGWTIV
jgi:NAD(P)-dependent dehydrogenase (short-subunit alcohol dehydrogenase family)